MVLGRVCKLQPHENTSKRKHRQVVDGTFFIAGGAAAILFEAVEEALDLVALTIHVFVKSTASPFVGLAGKRATNAAPPQELSESARPVGFVGDDPFGAFARTTMGRLDRALFEQVLSNRRLVAFPWREQHHQRLPVTIHPYMDFGRHPASAATERFAGGVTFFAPAAGGCARTTLPSSICNSQSTAPPSSA